MDDFSWIKQLPEGSPERKEAEALVAELIEVYEDNPLQKFDAHSEQQREFLGALTAVIAAFAGNRFGKTTVLIVKALIECVDIDCLPDRLRPFKRWTRDKAPNGVFGRIVCPDFTATAEGVILPAFRKWGPKGQWRGGSFDKAWDKQLRTLRFQNGSWIQVMTYEQDVDKFGGAALHFVGYDEPPPREIRDECLARLVDFGGFEMYAMTPLKANTGWIRRDIFKKREHPDVTVIKGSIHDNPTLDQAAKKRFLESLPSDLWRQAREFGDFVDVGGLIYARFEDCVVDRFDPAFIQGLDDQIVSIDPGIRNAAIIFQAFDDENVQYVYDEILLQDKTPADYAKAIRSRLEEWGVPFRSVFFVIDPAARARSQVNAESVETALAREGIYCAPGQNQVEAGVQQVRTRIQHKRIKVGRNCVGLRDEADEYAAEDRPDGEFKPIKENDHRLDALRYASMARAWDPRVEEEAPERTLGSYGYGEAPPAELLAGAAVEHGPMGFMS